MNGNGKIEGLLERIATTMEQTRDEVSQLRGEVVELRGEVVELRGEVVELRGEQVRLREDTHEALVRVAVEQGRTRDELAALRDDMNRGFAQVNGRIDNVLAIAGRHHDDHEQRIQVLEEHVLGSKRSG